MFRYLGLISDPKDHAQSQVSNALIHHLKCGPYRWNEAVDEAGFRLYCTDDKFGSHEPYTLHGKSGVVFGAVFARDEQIEATFPARKAIFGPEQSARIVATQGRELIAAYWGNYVAFVRDPVSGKRWIMRDPTGKLPCYYTSHRGVTVFFSYATDCLALGIPKFDINWSQIRQRVAGSTYHQSHQTALDGVLRLHGGECIEFSDGKQTRKSYWNPVKIAQSDPIEDERAAAVELRSTIKHCTHAWASRHQNVLHRLSGGLDSSIVLGCLADAPTRPNITCLTMYVPGEASDERKWARLAVRHARCDHVEIAEDCTISLKNMLRAAPNTQPEFDVTYLQLGTEKQLAHDRKATASFNGDGGDNVFGASTVRFAVADYFARHAFTGQLLSVAADTAFCLNVSIWKLLSGAVRDKFFNAWSKLRPPNTMNRQFLSSDAFADFAVNHWPDHPWFQAGDNACRTVARTIAPLSQPDSFYDPLNKPDDSQVRCIAPLLSQPVVEVCLRIPSYVHAANGRSRGLARQAFVNDVPREILQRQWKDFPPKGGFALMFEQNRHLIREVLLDGLLMGRGLLNQRKLADALAKEDFEFTMFDAVELIEHMNTECWLRNWAGLTHSTTYRKLA